ncbi:lipocalin-like domain-containing protein [Luteibacter sp.]|jgi:hypothetical protein|uniref:lipocalin-like domain-containing protein n=1 Tax=Luteibacter sp. TaxID=1886636 RepID=UPI002F42B2A2
MNFRRANTGRIIVSLLTACAFWNSAAFAGSAPEVSPLAGTWTLVAADVHHPDGSRASDYGAKPEGLLLVDSQGHYSLQIFKAERLAFGLGNKAKGTPEEYASAVMGSSTHFGTLSIDRDQDALVFHIQGASFPNWEGQEQRRHYELKSDTLSYRVTPRPNGDVPISVWRKIE